MFEGLNGLTMTGDHLDISYRDPDSWPSLTPQGSIKAHIFNVGDPVSGPNIQLGLIRPIEGEVLDWRHSIDPLHHHGSDQFRIVFEGKWNVAGRKMAIGQFSFQESGMVYQEHPGEGGLGYTLLIMGDRRGNQATLALARDAETIFEYGEVYGAPREDVPYPHPAGSKGIAAIATNIAPVANGFVRGAPGEDVATGVLGDRDTGPIVHVLRADPHETVLPRLHCDSEIIVGLTAGSCSIGDCQYRAKEIRVQRADTMMEPILAGPDGAELVLIIAERRARFAAPDGECPSWLVPTELIRSIALPA